MSTLPAKTTAKVLSTKELQSSDAKWLGLKKVIYRDLKGNERPWEMAYRKTRSTGGVDAVAICAILRDPSGQEPLRTILTKQFRPPTEKMCIEFPAGLIDQGENARSTAIRELKEECGYLGTFMGETILIHNDPGMTNTNMQMVTLDVDMSQEENQNPQTNLQDGEDIETIIVPLKGLYSRLTQFQNDGLSVDARLLSFALGIFVAKNWDN